MKNIRPLSIAVVIPAFNAEKTIEASITSALEQTEPPEEIIVVDDGSQDATYSVVNKFGNRVRMIRQKHKGSAIARQTGTLSASAEFIAYLDADDWWIEQKNARYREILNQEHVDFLFSDFRRARPGNDPEDYLPRNISFYPWVWDYFKGRALAVDGSKAYKLESELATRLLLRGFPIYPSTMLVRRTAAESVGGWDGRFRRSQDFDFSLRIVRNYSLHYLDEVLAIVGLHPGNDDAYAYVVKQTDGDIKVLEAHLETAPGGSPYSLERARALGHRYCSLGYTHRKAGHPKLARQSYAKALKYPGRRLHALSRWAVSLLSR